MGTGPDGNGSILTLIGFAGTFIGFVSALVLKVAAGAWKGRGIQAGIEKKFAEDIANLRTEILKKIDDLRQEAADKRDEAAIQVGESLAALRQKAADMELWNRDHLVSDKSLEIFRQSNEASFARLDTNITHLNTKIDWIIKGVKGDRDHR